jgi:hypothetical protein
MKHTDSREEFPLSRWSEGSRAATRRIDGDPRHCEIGVGMAFSAQQYQAIILVMVHQGIRAARVVLGLIGSAASTCALTPALLGIEPTDPLTSSAVTLALRAVALCACYISARHAAIFHLMVELRYG